MIDQKISPLLFIFLEATRKKGKMISLPKNTDLTKTYLWRYLKNFYDRCLEENLSEDEIPFALKGLVDASAADGSLHRNGITVLDRRDLLSLGIKRIEKEIRKENTMLNDLIRSYDYLIREKNDRRQLSNYDILKNRKNHDGYANITCWFLAGKITADFMAITTSCQRTIKEITGPEREMLPSDEEFKQRERQLCFRPNVLLRFKEVIKERKNAKRKNTRSNDHGTSNPRMYEKIQQPPSC